MESLGEKKELLGRFTWLLPLLLLGAGCAAGGTSSPGIVHSDTRGRAGMGAIHRALLLLPHLRTTADFDFDHSGLTDETDFLLLKKKTEEVEVDLQPLVGGADMNEAAKLLLDEQTVLKLFTDERASWFKDKPVEALRYLTELNWLLAQSEALTSRGGGAGGLLTNYFGGDILERENGDGPISLCAISKMSMLRLVENEKPGAIFDLDETVWDGHIIDGFLGRLLMDQPTLSASARAQVVQALIHEAGIDAEQVHSETDAWVMERFLIGVSGRSIAPGRCVQRISRKTGFYGVAAMLEGMSIQAVKKVAERVFTSGSDYYKPWLDYAFVADGCEFRQVIKAMGEWLDIYLLSASFHFLAQESALHLGLSPSIAQGSELEIRKGRYTGKVAFSTYRKKAVVARHMMTKPALFAFGDSLTSDFGFMREALGVSFMMNPPEAMVAKNKVETQSRMVELRLASKSAAKKTIRCRAY